MLFRGGGATAMQSIIRWTVGLGLLWFGSSVGLGVLATAPEAQEKAPQLVAIATQVKAIGSELGTFIAPILQLALVLLILVAVAERFGFTTEKRDWSGFVSTTSNVQAFIAVVIVSALVIGALAGIARVDVLKDIALVVVGFYFGTRRSQTSIDEAVQAGTAAGVAAAAQAAAAPAERPPSSAAG